MEHGTNLVRSRDLQVDAEPLLLEASTPVARGVITVTYNGYPLYH